MNKSQRLKNRTQQKSSEESFNEGMKKKKKKRNENILKTIITWYQLYDFKNVWNGL